MDTLIGSFSQNELEEVRVHLRRWKGRDYVDIRAYAALKSGGEKIPTGKGLSIDIRQWEEFKKLVLEAENRSKHGV